MSSTQKKIFFFPWEEIK